MGTQLAGRKSASNGGYTGQPDLPEDQAKEMVECFVHSACTSQKLLVSLIERVELIKDKGIIIHF